MKKQLYLLGSAMTLGFASAAGCGVSAIETSGIASEADLANCLTSVSAVCTLGGDIDLTKAIIITGETELNLGSYKISEGDTFDHTNWGLLTVANGASLTINGGEGAGLFTTEVYSAVRMTDKDTYNKDKVASLVVNGGTLSGRYYGIVGNGNRHNTEITINGGIVKGNAEGDNSAIYHPQTGILNINGGTVIGDTGIAIKSGTLNMNGGEIIATGVDNSPAEGYSNGVEATGAAIQIESNTDYAGDIKLNFNGGKVTSGQGIALYEYIKQGEENTAVKEVNFKNAELKGATKAYLLSTELKDSDVWANSIVNGSTIKEETETKFVVSEVTEVEGLKEGERLIIEKSEIDETEGEKINELAIKNGIENLETSIIYDVKIVDADGKLVPNHEGKVTFVMPIEGSVEPAEGFTRDWYLFYFHENELKEIKDFTVENGKLTFSTDEFSTYILAYEDKQILTEDPETESSWVDTEVKAPETGSFTKDGGYVAENGILASIVASIVTALGAVAVVVRRTIRK